MSSAEAVVESIPLGIKLIYTAFVALLVPVYLRAYGVANSRLLLIAAVERARRSLGTS